MGEARLQPLITLFEHNEWHPEAIKKYLMRFIHPKGVGGHLLHRKHLRQRHRPSRNRRSASAVSPSR
jgi:hypothetical protein